MTGGHDRFLGHPKGLYVLVFTEMWERFSFYGMRALLVFFLTERFLFSDALSFATYGSYAALVYLSPILGGLLADRYLGFSKAVVFGGVLMIAGHFGLALEDFLFPAPAQGQAAEAIDARQMQIFYLSLAFLVAGVGLLKPNISTMVGGLYPKEGHLRDSGYTLFVWGINFGAMAAAIVCGYVGQAYGWGYGFGLAGLGILIGMVIFICGQKHLHGIGEPPDAEALREPLFAGLSRQAIIYVCVLLSVLAFWYLVQRVAALGHVVVGTFAAATVGSIVFGVRRLERRDRQQLFAAVMLMTVWVSFAALIEQVGSSINLFTERVIDRQVGGLEIRAAQLQAILPFLVIVTSPFFAWVWGYLQRHELNPSTPLKFASALGFLALGFAAVTFGAMWPDEQSRIHILWLFLLYFFFAVGDLLIAPVGLSAVTKLAPRQILGFMMGLWMLSVAIGNYFAASIAQLSALGRGLRSAQAVEVLVHYQAFFGRLALGALLLGAVALALTPLIRRWMHGIH